MRPSVYIIAVVCVATFVAFSTAGEPAIKPPSAGSTLSTGKTLPKPSGGNKTGKSTGKKGEDKEKWDVVILVSGREISGKVIDTHGPTIQVKRKLGSITIEKKDIQEVLWGNRMAPSMEKNVDRVYTTEDKCYTGKVKMSRNGRMVIVTKIFEGREQDIYIPRIDVVKIIYAGSELIDLNSRPKNLDAYIQTLIAALGSGSSLDKLDAREKLINLGITALDLLRKKRPTAPIASRTLIDEILHLAELKKYITSGIMKDVPDINTDLMSKNKDDKIKALRNVALFRQQDAVPLFSYILSREEEDLNVRVYCMNFLKGKDYNKALISILGNSRDGRLRFLAAIYLGENGILVGIETIINALKFPDNKVRDLAAQKLKEFTGQDFLYFSDATPEQRENIFKRWWKWWEANRNNINDDAERIVQKRAPTALQDARAFQTFQEASLAWQEGDVERAALFFRKTIEHKPNHASARICYATALFELGRLEEAARAIDILFKRYRKEADNIGAKRSHYLLGLIELEQLHWEKAKAQFDFALVTDEKYIDALIALGRTCYLQAVHDDELKITKSDMADRTIVEWKNKQYGTLLKRAEENLVKAVDLIKIRFDKERSRKHIRLAKEARRETVKAARNTSLEFSILDQADRKNFIVDLRAKAARIFSMLADISGVSRDFKGATKFMEKAARYDKSKVAYHVRLAQLYEISDRVIDAMMHFRKGAELEKGNAIAEAGILRLEQEYEKRVAAKKEMEKKKNK